MKFEEFQTEKKRAAERIVNEAKKPGDVQNWTEDLWIKIPAEVVCRTPGCPVADKVFPVALAVNADELFRVSCGRCGKMINDVVGIFDDTKAPLDTPEKSQGRGRK